jgi:isorenieratene synthase
VGELNGTYHAFSAVCPHLGGRLQWVGPRFVCDLHKGEFDVRGDVVKPPPTDPLHRLTVRVAGTDLEILGTPSRRLIPCSHVIVATDVPHAQRILDKSPGVPAALRARMHALKTTPVIVVRLWLAHGTPVPSAETIVFPAPVFADVYFHLNAIDRSYDPEGVIVELHCCDVKPGLLQATDDHILGLVFRDLATLDPRLTRSTMRDPRAYTIFRHEAVFTLYAPGDAAHRPGAASGIVGLHLAGDWTTADWSVWMMERAVVSGLRAANRVLGSHGLPAAPIVRLDPEGPLLVAARWLARGIRRLAHRHVP